MSSEELHCQTAVDNAYNTYSCNKQITKLDAEYMLETKAKVSSTYFWDYVRKTGGMQFYDAVSKTLSKLT